MAAITDYATLKAAILDWAARGDTSMVNRVDTFVQLGEERIWNNLRSPRMISLPIALTINAGQNWAALPADWLGFARIVGPTDYPRVEYMPADQLEDLQPTGDGGAYSIEGGRFIYGQTPAANLPLSVKYYQHPGYLSVVSTTWLLTMSPSIYLYAGLLESAIYAKNTAKITEYGSLLDKAIEARVSADEGDLYRGGRLRMSRHG